MTTPDASTTRTGSNPFGDVAKPAAELRVTELTADRDQLDRDNELLGSQIAELLSDKFAAALADDHESLEEQIASAQALNEDLEAIKAMLTGTSSVASAPALTDLQQQAVDDINSGRLFQHRSGAWGDEEWSTRRPATSTPAPAPAAPAATPAPVTPPATPAPAPAAPAAPSAPATPPATPAPAPAAPAAPAPTTT